jgi:hypothetical protein
LIEVTDKHLPDSKPLAADGLKFCAEALLKNMENRWSFLKLEREEDLRSQD